MLWSNVKLQLTVPHQHNWLTRCLFGGFKSLPQSRTQSWQKPAWRGQKIDSAVEIGTDRNGGNKGWLCISAFVSCQALAAQLGSACTQLHHHSGLFTSFVFASICTHLHAKKWKIKWYSCLLLAKVIDHSKFLLPAHELKSADYRVSAQKGKDIFRVFSCTHHQHNHTQVTT